MLVFNNMKWIIFITTSLYISMSYSATYSLTYAPYSFNVPDNWETKEGTKTVFIFGAIMKDSLKVSNGKTEAHFRANILVSKDSTSEEVAKQYKANSISYIRENQAKMTPGLVQEISENRTINGLKGIFLVSQIPSQTTMVTSFQFSFMEGTILYSFIYSVPVSYRKKYEDMIMKSIGSIKRR
jgi:hypothetical protein